MPITEKQKELRKQHLGSSDVAAILGVDPWRNAYDVWLEKTGRVEDSKETEVMYAGTMFEDGILKYAEGQLGKLIRNQYRSAIGFPIAANIDAIVKESGEPVEAKTAGLFGPVTEEWGDGGTDQIPDRVIIQVHVHMLCTDKDICHIPAFIGGKGFNMFMVKKDDEIMNIIMDQSIEFWGYVENDCPPPNCMPSMPLIKRMKREPNKVTEIDPILIQNWENAKASLKLAQEIEEGAKTEMLAALGEAEAGTFERDGLQMTLTFFEQSRRYVDSKKLKEDYPDLYKMYEKVSVFRVPRVKKPKKDWAIPTN